MAMFLSETNPSRAGAGGGRAQTIVQQSASIGPPRAPPASFAALPGGISLLPNVPALPTAAGVDAGRVSLQPYGRIPSRANVTLEKNPRIALAYNVKQFQEGLRPTQGDLVAMSLVNGWDVPEILTIDQLHRECCRRVAESNDPHKAFSDFFKTFTFCGVYNAVFEAGNQKQLDKYGTDTVTINAARFCSIRDYWGTDIRAGDTLYFVAVHVDAPGGGGPPAAKRQHCDEVEFYFVKSGNLISSATDVVKTFKESYNLHSVVIRLGKAQNYIPPIISRGGSVTAWGSENLIYKNSHGTHTTRLREVHLDHLMIPIEF